MNLRALCIAGAAALTLGLSGQAAEAKTKVFIGIGNGFGSYCQYNYDPRCYGYYPNYRYRDRIVDYYRISCGEARDLVDNSGFRKVRTRSCGGKFHTFFARKKDGNYLVKVRANNGRIVSVNPI